MVALAPKVANEDGQLCFLAAFAHSSSIFSTSSRKSPRWPTSKNASDEGGQSGHSSLGGPTLPLDFWSLPKIAASSKRVMNGEPKSPRIPALGLAQAVISVRAVRAQARNHDFLRGSRRPRTHREVNHEEALVGCRCWVLALLDHERRPCGGTSRTAALATT